MTGALPNIERLKALYDPDYVHRVETADGAPVQVCLDSRQLYGNEGTGVATYARMLAKCLPDAGAAALLLDDGAGQADRTGIARWLSAARGGSRLATALGDPSPGAATPWVVRDVFREAQVFYNLHGRSLPIEMDHPPQVMHWTYPVPLHVVGAKNLYSVHDLIPILHPALTRIARTRHAGILRQIVRHAHGIVTVSETVRQEIMAYLQVAPAFVHNTYQGVDAPLQADPRLPDGLRAGRYFFFCGRIEPRKNLERLARAHRASGVTMPLVVVGPAVAGEERLETVLRAQPGVVRLAWAPRADLLAMMRHARALLFPSLAEGFGLPVAEAMTLGCPVLTSDRGALAEVAGGAALLVDPEDEAALAKAIAGLEHDDWLCTRLREAGFARGNMFAQGNYARRLRALYAGALATTSPAPGDRR
jgi:glycosyltransferase involved in cell wall biosynthesis